MDSLIEGVQFIAFKLVFFSFILAAPTNAASNTLTVLWKEHNAVNYWRERKLLSKFCQTAAAYGKLMTTSLTGLVKKRWMSWIVQDSPGFFRLETQQLLYTFWR